MSGVYEIGLALWAVRNWRNCMFGHQKLKNVDFQWGFFYVSYLVLTNIRKLQVMYLWPQDNSCCLLLCQNLGKGRIEFSLCMLQIASPVVSRSVTWASPSSTCAMWLVQSLAWLAAKKVILSSWHFVARKDAMWQYQPANTFSFGTWGKERRWAKNQPVDNDLSVFEDGLTNGRLLIYLFCMIFVLLCPQKSFCLWV